MNNVLNLANLDFDKIGLVIDNNCDGSIETYYKHLDSLISDFESAFSLAILTISSKQMMSSVKINIAKVSIALKTVEIFKNSCENNKHIIEKDLITGDLIDNLFIPILDAHYNKLRNIKRLFLNAFPLVGQKEDIIIDIKNDSDQSVDAEKNNEEIANNILDEYSEFLTIKDMESILNVKRNAIYNYEKEGHFKRCSARNKTVLFKKSDIISYLKN